MKTLSIKKKKDSEGTIINTLNYDICIDGKPIDAKCLKSIGIKLEANERAVVSLDYVVDNIDIESIPIQKIEEGNDDQEFISMWTM